MKSIFDELKNALGCQYISDIKNERPLKILNAIGRMELSDYSLSDFPAFRDIFRKMKSALKIIFTRESILKTACGFIEHGG